MVRDDDNVDLVAMEEAQWREKAARDVEEVAIRDAGIAYDEEMTQRMAQNQPLDADQIGNVAPNQVLSSVRPPPVAANNFKLKQGLLQTLQNCCVFRGKINEDTKHIWWTLSRLWTALNIMVCHKM